MSFFVRCRWNMSEMQEQGVLRLQTTAADGQELRVALRSLFQAKVKSHPLPDTYMYTCMEWKWILAYSYANVYVLCKVHMYSVRVLNIKLRLHVYFAGSWTKCRASGSSRSFARASATARPTASCQVQTSCAAPSIALRLATASVGVALVLRMRILVARTHS